MQNEADVNEDCAELHAIQKHEYAVTEPAPQGLHAQQAYGGNVDMVEEHDLVLEDESWYIHVDVFKRVCLEQYNVVANIDMHESKDD